MSFEQRVVQLEETNAELVKEVVRVRDAAAGLNRIYPSVTAGRQAVSDGEYFVVPGDGAYQRLYRRSGSSADLIAEFPSRESLQQAIADAEADAEARMNAAADRAEVYADNKGFVTRERLRRQATLDLDFAAGEYSVDDGDKLRTTDGSEILTVERASPKWVMGPNGRLREVPPDTLAREWKDGKCQGALIEESRTNLLRWSEDFTKATWYGAGPETTRGPEPGLRKGSFATKVTRTESSGSYVRQTVTLSEGTYVFSLFCKLAGGDERGFRVLTSASGFGFDLLTGEIFANGVAGIPQSVDEDVWVEKLSGGWWRVSLKVERSSEGSTWFEAARLSLGTSVYVWGAQLEKGPTSSSYIPTEDAPVTRAADDVYRSSAKDVWNAQGGSIYADFVFPDRDFDSTELYFGANGTASAERWFISSNSAGDLRLWHITLVDGQVVSDGVSLASLGQVRGKRVRVVSSISGTEVRGLYNGSALQSTSIPRMCEVKDVGVGRRTNSSSESVKGVVIKDAMYIPRALSEEEMIALTTPEE